MKIEKFIKVLIVVMSFNTAVYASEVGRLYSDAIRSARSDQPYFALMHYREILRNNPKPKYESAALFATAEYSYIVSNYDDAVSSFKTYIKKEFDNDSKQFALMYLYEIAKLTGNKINKENTEPSFKR